MSLRVDRLPSTHILSAILQVISWYLVEYPLLLRKKTVTRPLIPISETDIVQFIIQYSKKKWFMLDELTHRNASKFAIFYV